MNNEVRSNLKRKVICKSLENIIPQIKEESFIAVENTKAIFDKVYEKFNDIEEQQEIINHLELNLNRISNLREEFKDLLDESGILFHYEDRISGAVKVNVEDFFDNLSNYSQFSKFSSGYRDLIFVDENLRYGICIERLEYCNKLIVWKE